LLRHLLTIKSIHYAKFREEIKGSWNELKGNLNRNSQNLQMMIYCMKKDKKTKCGENTAKTRKTKKEIISCFE
jgi:hypothetical protein